MKLCASASPHLFPILTDTQIHLPPGPGCSNSDRDEGRTARADSALAQAGVNTHAPLTSSRSYSELSEKREDLGEDVAEAFFLAPLFSGLVRPG